MTRLGEWPEQRVGLFVDTQNLYYSARETYGGHVDYARLLELALCGRRLSQATAYVVEREGEATAFSFISKLSILGYRVRRRIVRFANENSRNPIGGDWDMGIAADMVRSWGYLDVIVLASGDGDFAPFVYLAQERGCRVEVMAFKETSSQDLVDQADLFISLSEQHDIFIKGEQRLKTG